MQTSKRKSLDLLPVFFRTEKNDKFLSSTIDQLISTPQLTRIDGFVGSKNTPNYKDTDQYLSEINPIREAYQLEPALIIRTLTQEIKKAFAVDDLLNQVSIQGGNSSNLDRLFTPEFYSYDPKIDWDKFVNFRDYYWLPTGPNSIIVTGSQQAPIVEYNVTDADDKIQFLFGGLVTTQQLVLYRGSTYVFNIDSTHNFYIKYTNEVGPADQYNKSITGNGIKKGQIILTVDWSTPKNLYYVSNDNQLSSGMIIVKEPELNSTINVDNEIIGKKHYTTTSNIKFINGLKIRFDGTVYPESYRDADFIIEGVGDGIKLVRYTDLETPDAVADTYNPRFDGSNFDEFPFDSFKNIPIVPEYITINRASKDLNPWSRYNRWFHVDVLTTIADYNNSILDLPVEYRAVRPIIEFVPDLQLFNFGTNAISNIDLIDNTYKNVFRDIEGHEGFYVDGVLLEEGFRIIFNADDDPLVRGKVFRATFVKSSNGSLVLDLVDDGDIISAGTSALVKQGHVYAGETWYFNGIEWLLAQQRSVRNQAPLFDLFDKDGISYGNTDYYLTSFAGNKIFGYGIGSGVKDSILGFSLLYKNIGIEGTYLFKNYFSTDEFIFIGVNSTDPINTSKTFFKINGVLTNVWSKAEPYTISNSNGIYDVPLNLTNNPMNLPIEEFTLSELVDHVTTMIRRDPDYQVINGSNNLKDLPFISKYGTRLISNANSLSFAHHFITDKENSIIDAVRLVGEHYVRFKFNLIKAISEVNQDLTPAAALDIALQNINQNKTTTFPYFRSDMIPAGPDVVARSYRVTDSRNKKYSLPFEFDITKLSSSGVLVYLNDIQLVIETEYLFDNSNSNVEILVSLERNDVITINQYTNTNGLFVPPTPTKLGLFPKYEPTIFLDDTYADEPVNVLQGHDGSLTVAFNDYRDNILLEYEKRIYNNIKVSYNPAVFDINSILPGKFRNSDYTYSERLLPVHRDFLKWKSSNGVEVEKNLIFNFENIKTYNYSLILQEDGTPLPGNWRAIFKLYFDTDRPHSHPWEMLGFTKKPNWWEEEYGPAPYTSGNEILWQDIEAGRVARGPTAGINTQYARPGLLTFLPVNENGNLINFRDWAIIGSQSSLEGIENDWKFGDLGPAENAWRRSSFWPFAVQIIASALKPASYASYMFDTSRLVKNVVGSYVYNEDNLFLNPSRVVLPYDTINNSVTLTSGYSVFVVEAGSIRNKNYLNELKTDLQNSTFNLMNKVGGFVSKDKLQIVIDSVNPNSINPGVLLPIEDYSIHFNVSNPITTISISGVIIQRNKNEYIVRGYDQISPYFDVYLPIRQRTDRTVTVGATNEEYIPWSSQTYYPTGQIVYYQSGFYRVADNHNSGDSFNASHYRQLTALPTVGGISVLRSALFEKNTTRVTYGTSYSTMQEVADFLAGYEQYLTSLGFIFDEYNNDLNSLLDWEFSTKEFLFWATQNWSDNSVIAVSPFSNKLSFKYSDSVVDTIFSSFYEYSLLKSDGNSFPPDSFSIARVNGLFTITTKNTISGLFFARLRLVQKEHAIIINNVSRFNDVIYDIETGYRQRRVRLIGFRTTEWNGDFYSPGFIYDSAQVQSWAPYEDYIAGDVVEYVGNYYSLNKNTKGKETFDFTDWSKLGEKPVAQLIPNFDYKISQFEDFYSLDIDNFDVSQQQLAQHLIGYSSRVYLDNIFLNPIAQYKFYQGFIKEKGTKNALDKLARASVHNLQGKIDFSEQWAFRVGMFGAFSSESEIEFPLSETDFVDNSQVIKFVNEKPYLEYDSLYYVIPSEFSITTPDYTVDTTFSTDESTFNDTKLIMPVAGYVRRDDVENVFLSKDELLNYVPSNTVSAGDTFWIAFDENKDWGVYRYVRLPASVTKVIDEIYGQSLRFTTNKFHGLKVGNTISITALSNEINGVFIVSEIPRPDEFIVLSTKGTPAFTSDFGMLFKFASSRFSTFDDIVSADYIADAIVNRKVWVDEDDQGKWTVYKKIDNYTSSVITDKIIVDAPYFGHTIISKEDNNIFLVSAPSYDDGSGSGNVFVYSNTNGVIKLIRFWGINSRNNQYYINTTAPKPANFGFSMDYDSVNGIIVAGAPFASGVKADAFTPGIVLYISDTNEPREYDNDGLIVISTVHPKTGKEKRHAMIAYGAGSHDQEFGYSVFISSTATNNILLAGAPGAEGTGIVESFDITYTPAPTDQDDPIVNVTATSIAFPGIAVEGARFGHKIAGNVNGSKIAISAPGTGNGSIYVYQRTDTEYILSQTIHWNDADIIPHLPANSGFGKVTDMDEAGNWLFVSCPDADDNTLEVGKVVIYKWDNDSSQFKFSQFIQNPSSISGLKFGVSLESDATGSILGITSQGPYYYNGVTFDNSHTTFDAGSTKFGSTYQNAGTAYLFNRYKDKFIFGNELFNNSVNNDSLYGYSISVDRNAVYIGAPLSTSTSATRLGQVIAWNAIDPTLNTWSIFRQQNEIINVEKIKQIRTIDTFNESVVDYLEVFDPAKGKIPTVADQEIRYKTFFDPAIYNTGTSTNIVLDEQMAWGSEHVGELWWDLSSVKYVWYEQGDIEFRKNTWGQIFPGCSIDVYEWVSSENLPDQWVSLSGTTEGRTLNISGTPRYTGDAGYCIDKIYNAQNNNYSNRYYFWVKNIVTIPNRQGRTVSAYDVANLILDPKYSGLKYIQPLSNNALSIINVKGSLINSRISLNIQRDEIINRNNKHTEWLLVEEGSAQSMPNFLLEKKFIDSLLGRDSLGNPVPDPTLTDRMKYGIGVRPRQSMFKDRESALRNVITYVNDIFKNNLIVDFYNLNTLHSKDSYTSLPTDAYDVIVEDLAARDTLYIKDFKQAILTCELLNGKIDKVNIVNPGIGYGKIEEKSSTTWKGPAVSVLNDVNGAKIETTIDANGSIVEVIIVNPGMNYASSPKLVVRSFSAVVESDSDSKGKWAIYSYLNSRWIKVKTQSYDTTLYWDFVDWAHSSYNQYQAIVKTVDHPYQVNDIDVSVGSYVKVKNNGLGRYLILEKIKDGSIGTYNSNYNIIVSEKGTIYIKDSLWKTENSQVGFDQISPYDNSTFDQAPTTELSQIISALKNDILIGNLKVYWNKLFFAAVKYTLTEQKFIDWAFKTSFISVQNKAGSLTQRPVYKFQDTTWYENYLKEIKPYHTQIRDYRLTYDFVEPSQTIATDFDLPLLYNPLTERYNSLSIDDPLMMQYPYKSWYDNYTLYLESISVTNGGSGYTAIPEIKIISAPGDTVTRIATASALVASGKIIEVEITDPGAGYTLTPTVLLLGGGDLSNLVPAILSPVMNNGKVRMNKISLKFDRISKSKEIVATSVSDEFIANGIQVDYVLNWPASPDKATFIITQNGIIVPSTGYSIEDFVDNTEGYNKWYTKVTMRQQYDRDTVINISYKKSLKIYNAYDRIDEFYDPTPGMPGKNAEDNYAQLMKGMEYPGTKISTLPFERDYSWDSLPYSSVLWDPISSQIIDLDTIYDGGAISTSTPFIPGHWTTFNTITTSGVWISEGWTKQYWSTSTSITTSTPWVSGHWAQVGAVTTTTPWISDKWTSIRQDALGVDPTEIILDGDQFLSPWRSYGPEELVPGHVNESVAINVFTRSVSGSPNIYSLIYNAVANTSTTIEYTFDLPTNGSFYITYNQELLSPEIDFVIDTNTKTITVLKKEIDGKIKLTYNDVGGSGFISLDSVRSEGSTIVSLVGSASYDEVNSVLVTANGNTVKPESQKVVGQPYYVLAGSETSTTGRAEITVHGLAIGGVNVIVAAFFTSKFKGFSEMREQIDLTVGYNNMEMILDQPPGNLGPASTNSIVELNGRRISPPNTTYYIINNINETTFKVSTKEDYLPNTFDLAMIEVYLNGLLVSEDDYYLDQPNNEIIFIKSNYFSLGDVVAVTALIDFDYYIHNTILYFTDRVVFDEKTNYVRVITFTNQDSSLINTQVFKANSAKFYKLSRTVINDNYVWVSVGDKTLTSGIDFEVVNGSVVRLDPDIPFVDGEDVIITTFVEPSATKTIGFKIFKDMVGRHHFKRLSDAETTYLIEPLMLDDTTIVVENGDVLPSVTNKSNVPGIIFIAGERIEYMEKNGNILSKIRRATLGTGAKDFYAVGTWVTDQGKSQNMPKTETVTVESMVIDSSTSTYLIPESITFLELVPFHNQVEVYYGGRLLEKPTAPGVIRYLADSTSSYNSISGIELQPDFTITTGTSTGTYYLNFNIEMIEGIKVMMVQRKGTSWYFQSDVSLINDDRSRLADFLNQRNATTPDIFYYGGDPTLTFDDGFKLVLDDGREIKTY